MNEENYRYYRQEMNRRANKYRQRRKFIVEWGIVVMAFVTALIFYLWK